MRVVRRAETASRDEYVCGIADHQRPIRDPDRLAVCLDTCHLFAAGYPLSPEKEYRSTMKRLDQVLGVKLVKAIHVNDSKRELGSRVDRHEHIGRGQIGLEGFRLLVNDRRFAKTPMYLETPKEENGEPKGMELDRMNLAVLRSLVAQSPAQKESRTKPPGGSRQASRASGG